MPKEAFDLLFFCIWVVVVIQARFAESREFACDDYLEVLWGNTTFLEKIIYLVMIENERPCIAHQIRKWVKERCGLHVEAREASQALESLADLRFLLRRVGK